MRMRVIRNTEIHQHRIPVCNQNPFRTPLTKFRPASPPPGNIFAPHQPCAMATRNQDYRMTPARRR
jgi:hypothetical protein